VEVVVKNKAWLCLILCRALCSQGELAARKEVAKLAGDSFVDFKLTDDGFEGECYAFLRCVPELLPMSNFRSSNRVIGVLDSYSNPKFLTDKDVQDFIKVPEKQSQTFKFGDTVLVLDGRMAKLYGIVVGSAGNSSLVLFRFHITTREEWIDNNDLSLTGTAFSVFKFPVQKDCLVRVPVKAV
jgi:hypothetical protein